jgi:hypothetical protein
MDSLIKKIQKENLKSGDLLALTIHRVGAYQKEDIMDNLGAILPEGVAIIISYETINMTKKKLCNCCKKEASMEISHITQCSYCFNVCTVIDFEECTKTDNKCKFVFPIEDTEIECENINCDGNHKGEEVFGDDEGGHQLVKAEWSYIEGFDEYKSKIRDDFYKKLEENAKNG